MIMVNDSLTSLRASPTWGLPSDPHMQTAQFKLNLEGDDQVSALVMRPAQAHSMYVFAHGAGAGMTHSFMEEVAIALAARGIATLRFNFPFMETLAGKRWARTDSPKVAQAAVRAAVRAAGALAPDLPLFAGGKSFGARMTSQMQAEGIEPNVRGLVFIGYPLHLANKPSLKRAQHLPLVQLPMLVLQGTRDSLARSDLLEATCAPLPLAHLHWIEGADHAFDVLVRSGRTHADVVDEIADAVTAWIKARLVE